MISKHDLLKRLWAFVHSHLIPTLVCSVGAQQTSFRICSTDLCVIERMGENIKRFSVDAFVLCCHKVFRSIAITLPVHQRDTLIICGIICWCVGSVASFLGCYDVEKRIDHSGKLLDLEKYVNVGFAEITSACHVLF